MLGRLDPEGKSVKRAVGFPGFAVSGFPLSSVSLVSLVSLVGCGLDLGRASGGGAGVCLAL